MSSSRRINSNPHNYAEEVVRHCLAEIGQPAEPTARLKDLALDSLTMVMVLVAVENALEVRFPDPEVERVCNLDQFVAVVERHAERKPAGSTVRLAKGA